MSQINELNELPVGGLVVYRNRPGCIRAIEGKRIHIELAGSEAVRVRPKDITLLHPGPVDQLPGVSAMEEDILVAWELLAGAETTFYELTDLIYGEWTPDAAWAVYLLLIDGLYFKGDPGQIRASTRQEVESQKALRLAKADEEKGWISFLQNVQNGQYEQSEERYLQDVSALALGKSDKSRVLSALGQKQSQEVAHAFLLHLGYWDETVNPYPSRGNAETTAPSAQLLDLAEEDRLDLTHLASFAIDDEGSRDPDDAISLDGTRLWVHIADVGALIAPDSPAEREARAKGANLYLPEGTITMLPPKATDLLGLGLAEISPALSFGLEIDRTGMVDIVEIVPSWIKVYRITYEKAELLLEDDPLEGISEICSRFQERREVDGAINIELPEVRVQVLDKHVIIKPLPRLRTRDLVREAMLMAGNAVAHYVSSHAIPVPFVAQERPVTEIEQATTMSEMFALRRSLKPGQYTNHPAPHAGLGLDLYVQVTSPLRRYLDLLIHQQLRSFLRGEELMSYQEMSIRLGSAEAARPDLRWIERNSKEHWTLVFLMRNPGWRGEGVVVDNRGSHALVLLPEIGLETRIYQKRQLPLDHQLDLELISVDLPKLTTHFRQVYDR